MSDTTDILLRGQILFMPFQMGAWFCQEPIASGRAAQ